MSNSVFYAGAIVLLLAISCKSNQIDSDKPPRIVFVNYNITKDSDGNIAINMINKIITEGKLKQDLSHKENVEFGDLKVIQTNNRSKPIRSIIIANPLVKNVEYADASGRLSRKIIELETTKFTIRMQLDPQTKYIIIKQLNDQNKRLTKNKL
jgi:hypothetical protein